MEGGYDQNTLYSFMRSSGNRLKIVLFFEKTPKD